MSEYKDADEIADIVFSFFTAHGIREAAKLERRDLIQFHHGTGRDIRNDFLLWETDNPYTDTSDPMGPLHPDQYSTLVMEKVLEKCKQWVKDNGEQ